MFFSNAMLVKKGPLAKIWCVTLLVLIAWCGLAYFTRRELVSSPWRDAPLLHITLLFVDLCVLVVEYALFQASGALPRQEAH